jgi:hypothetical protein
MPPSILQMDKGGENQFCNHLHNQMVPPPHEIRPATGLFFIQKLRLWQREYAKSSKEWTPDFKLPLQIWFPFGC